jgi:hypothetical protein
MRELGGLRECYSRAFELQDKMGEIMLLKK